MPLFQQVGGSLTTAAALTLLAWGVRLLRKKYNRGLLPYLNDSSQRQVGRFFCTLSPAALRMLVSAVERWLHAASARPAQPLQAYCYAADLYVVLIAPAYSVGEAPNLNRNQTLQVETDPIPHLVIDVRSAEAIQARPLPRELSLTALQLPLEAIEGALAGSCRLLDRPWTGPKI